MDKPTLRALALVPFAVVLAFARVAPAHACGGFFCNRQPIAQSGENILFSIDDDGSITAVVQIAYTGPSSEFAWILPVPSAPTIGVGTEALFDAIQPATAVVLERDYRVEGTCREIPSSCRWYDTFADGVPGARAGAEDMGGSASDAGAPVEILARSSVGPYDTVTLTGTDVTAITTWLTDNGFLVPAGATDKLGVYVAKHSTFVALKLRKDADTGDIQPVTLHYANGEPCIPIQLTAVATVDDLPITAYFVANHDMTSDDYAMTELDFDQAALWDGALSYQDAVSYAVDDAGGHAFVVDYEGAVPSVYGLELPAIEDLRTVTDPKAFLSSLLGRGYRGDAQVLSIFERFLPPPPDGTRPQDFYNCLGFGCSTYDAYLATLHFDPDQLVTALEIGIVNPRHDAQQMLTTHSRLTRLFTTLSAAEMTVDPTFATTPTRDVSNVHTATVVTLCSGDYLYWAAPQDLVLPSGRRTHLRDGIRYYGTDSELCADYMSGAFSPWSSTGTLRTTAAMRLPTRAAGGGGIFCGVASPFGGLAVTAPVVVLALVLGASVVRRRRRR